MSAKLELPRDPMLFGENAEENLIVVEHIERRGRPDEMALFFRDGDRTVERREPFRPFLVAALDAVADCPVEYEARRLAGSGPLNIQARFSSWRDYLKARRWLIAATGFSASAPQAPYCLINDPVQQYLMHSGRTLFRGMALEQVRRMQIDIECLTTEGYDFCNAEREGDRIVAIAMCDETGWSEVLSGAELDEAALLARFVAVVRERDPDVIEGYNIFNFDLPYIAARARRCGVPLKLGRDGSTPRSRPSRFSVGERTIAYERFDIFGRHVVDILFLVHVYDISHRSLAGLGLKEVARHFGLAADGRTYIDGCDIAAAFRDTPDEVMRYVRDDVTETRGLSDLLSESSFIQTQMLPYSYQNVCVRGTATKIDALMMREYLRQGHSLPKPDATRGFAGGYTDMFVEGVVRNVHHVDVRSLYPTLMLTRGLAPAKDELGVFLKLLDRLRTFRLEAKTRVRESGSEREKAHYDALQATFKVLINSFYGYLGFGQARFSDFSVAEEVTAGGRELLRRMIETLRALGATPVEIDTDGIYFVPPPAGGQRAQDGQPEPIAGEELERFRREFARALPPGIEVEFDGEYRSMYSYKMKNYALLEHDGEIVIKGAALKSRGLEPFQRKCLKDVIRLKLEERTDEMPALKEEYARAIREREWDIHMLAKTESLQDAPSTYAAKIDGKRRARSAAYELALQSEREYRAGDQVSYYVTGEKKSVAVHETARLVSEWDAENRDENVPYYLAKLDALFKKFAAPDAQQELDFQ